MAEQLGLYLGMFVKEGLVRDNETFRKLLSYAIEISNNYLDNPYHSVFHAIDVSYMTYYLLTEMGVVEQAHLLKIDIAALLLAAIGHDVLHPGLNNQYQVCTTDFR
jgi:3'5'-cyclic nucleotide phosphodiesterase